MWIELIVYRQSTIASRNVSSLGLLPDNVFLSRICPLFFSFSFAFKLFSLFSKVRCDTQAHPAPPIVVEQG